MAPKKYKRIDETHPVFPIHLVCPLVVVEPLECPPAIPHQNIITTLTSKI